MKKYLVVLAAFTFGILVAVLGMNLYRSYELNAINQNQSKLTPQAGLEAKVWSEGDIESYMMLRSVYRDYPPHYFLFWSMYMANKYDYSYAYEDVYRILEETYYPIDSAIFKMDDKTRQFALNYLKCAAFKGDTIAMNAIKELKDKGVNDKWLK